VQIRRVDRHYCIRKRNCHQSFETRPYQKDKNSGLPIKTIQQLKDEAEAICGKPEKIELSDEFVAAIKWVDGTVIDAVKKVGS